MDLCGPMPTVLRSGRLYSMHVIDDFSSYVWSLPLRSKADAASMFQLWHKHVTTQTGLPLKVLITDNGELVSKSMKEWCLSLGIDHVVTAPHTLAQNGHAERVHRTILGKAQAMRLACHAPSSLWDEFCATAAYLTVTLQVGRMVQRRLVGFTKATTRVLGFWIVVGDRGPLRDVG